jgi:hypothetical protein
LKLSISDDDGNANLANASRLEPFGTCATLDLGLVHHFDVPEPVPTFGIDPIHHDAGIEVRDVGDLLVELLQNLIRPSVRIFRHRHFGSRLLDRVRGGLDEQIHGHEGLLGREQGCLNSGPC